MRVAASTLVGESSLSEENDIYVTTPEDGKNTRCNCIQKARKNESDVKYLWPLPPVPVCLKQ